MENKKVSVIAAIYNVEKYLDECINSICAQSYNNLQIILVDDGSRDGSGTICDVWRDKDKRIIVKHQKNSGVSIARNVGMEIADGDYVVFVDSDDRVEPEFVATLVDCYMDGNLTIAGYYIDCINGTKVRSTPKLYGKEDKQKLPAESVVELFASGMFSAVWNKLYDLSVIKGHQLAFQNDMELGEDIIFNISYMKVIKGGFNIVNVPVYHYIKRGNESLDHKYRPNFIITQKMIYQSILRYIEEVCVSKYQRETVLQLYFNALIVAMDNLYENKDKLEKSKYEREMMLCKKEPEIQKLLYGLSGRRKFASSLRWAIISRGLFPIDYYLRYIVKKLLGLE